MNMKKGASLVEYGLVVGLIGVLAIGSVVTTGSQTADVFCRTAAGIERATKGSTALTCLGGAVVAENVAPAEAPPPAPPPRPVETVDGALYVGKNTGVLTQFVGYPIASYTIGPWARMTGLALVGDWPETVAVAVQGTSARLTAPAFTQAGVHHNLAINGFNEHGESYSNYFDMIVKQPGKVWSMGGGSVSHSGILGGATPSPFGSVDSIQRIAGRSVFVGMEAGGRAWVQGQAPVGVTLFDPAYGVNGNTFQYSYDWQALPGLWRDADAYDGYIALVGLDGSLWSHGAAFPNGPQTGAEPVRMGAIDGLIDVTVSSNYGHAVSGVDGAVYGFGGSASWWGGSPGVDGIYRLDSTFSGATAIKSGNSNLLVLGPGDRIYGLGVNTDGMLGAAALKTTTFGLISGAPSEGFRDFSPGPSLSTAVGKNGLVYYVGRWKMLESSTQRTSWTQLGSISDVKSVTTNGSDVYAIKNDGTLWRMLRSGASPTWSRVGLDSDWSSAASTGANGLFLVKH